MSVSKNKLIVTIAAALLSLATQRHSFGDSATWSANPMNSDWTNAQNWAPSTVPDGLRDVATFGASDVTDPAISTIGSIIDLDSIVFNPGASAFTITSGAGTNLILRGAGLVNNSGILQSVIKIPNGGGIFFFGPASAGKLTSFSTVGGDIFFSESSSAGAASFDISNTGSFSAEVSFADNSSAADAFISVSVRSGATFYDSATAANAVITAVTGGDVLFGTSSSAGNAVITASGDSTVSFTQSATADHSHLTASGAGSSGEPGAEISVGDTATAAEATFVLGGSSVSGAPGATMTFFNQGNAGNASITVNGGSNGGRGAQVLFQAQSDGGTASLSLFGDGQADFSRHSPGVVTVGSVAGDGQVVLGATALAIGSNNQRTSFSGLIEDGAISGGSLNKVGSGTLKLSGANTYTGGTTVNAGALVAGNRSGSATGPGPVQVNAGLLAGRGTIGGSVTIGSGSGVGAFLAPGRGAGKLTSLTIHGSLIFKADATYSERLNLKKTKSDQVNANGVTIESGAQFDLQTVGRGQLRIGKVATALNNTAATPINGTFTNLPEGATLEAGGNTLQVSYHGGDGNDLTLIVVE